MMTTVTATTPDTLSTPATTDASPQLTIAHLAGVLVGRRDAILAAARDRSTLLVGLLLVFAAAFAREYDAEDLRREPWHLLIPLVASIAVSLPLFLAAQQWRGSQRPFWDEYRAFLGLFWLTAPLALFYAIPFERFLSPAGAVTANLYTLALVVAWRIALMTRIVSVFTGRTLVSSFAVVMLIAAPVATALMLTVPMPVLQLMGGIRQTESEKVLQSVSIWGRLIAVPALPICLIAGLVALWRGMFREPPSLATSSRGLSTGPIMLASACVMAWLLVLPMTQREQRLRSDAEHMLRAGRVSEALATMSQHDRGDYPPAWDPPPRVGWDEPEFPDLLLVMRTMTDHPPAPWVRAIYLDKFERRWLDLQLQWEYPRLPEVEAILKRLREGPDLIARNEDMIDRARQMYASETASTTQPTTRTGAP